MTKRGNVQVVQADAVLVEARATRAEQVARAEELLARASLLRDRVARDFWELGRVLAALRAERAHAVLGFARFETLVATRLQLGRSTAFKLLSVAQAYPREAAVRLGFEKAYAVIGYAKAAGAEDPPAELVKANVKIGAQPLDQASIREVEEAAAALKPDRPLTLAARKQAAANRALTRAIVERAKEAGWPRPAVRVVGDEVRVVLTRRQAERLVRGA